MTSAPRGLPVEPSVALLFLAAVAAAWRWLRAGDGSTGRRRASGRPMPEPGDPTPVFPFRKHRAPGVRFAPPRYAPTRAPRKPKIPTSTPSPKIAGRDWSLDPKPERMRMQIHLRAGVPPPTKDVRPKNPES